MKKSIIILILGIYLILGLSSFNLFSKVNDWPNWRGINQNGISKEINWNPNILQNNVKILWRANVGQGHSNISIKDGLLVTQGGKSISGQGAEKKMGETVICFNAITGKKIWQQETMTEYAPYAGPRGTPTIDGKLVFTIGSKGYVHCFDLKTGKILWGKDLIAENLTSNTKWGFGGSPVVYGEKLILNVGKSGLVLNKFTGKVIWKSGGECWGIATPVLVNIKKKKACLLHTQRELLAVDLSNGNLIWSYPWPYVDADPILLNNRVYLFGGKPGNERARTIINLSDGSLDKSWPNKKMNLAFQSPIFFKNLLFGMTFDKKEHYLQCFDPNSEKLYWQEKLDDYAGFSIAGNYILLMQSDGYLSIVETISNSFKVVSMVKIFTMKNVGKTAKYQLKKCWTAPVMSHGKIYLRNSFGDIACVDVNR